MKHTYYKLGLLLTLWSLAELASGQPLVLTGLTPNRNARSVPQTTNVGLTFNQGLINNAATQGGLRLFSAQRGGLLRNGQGGSASVSSNTLSFNPTTNFKPGETVLVTSTTAIQSTSGTRLSRGQVYQFTAGVGGSGRGNFAPPAVNPEPGVGGGAKSVAVGDVDGDGDLDLLSASPFGSTVSVRLNNGSGDFTPHPTNPEPGVGSQPQSVALGDVDGDGDLDLITANANGNVYSNGTVSVRLNNGSGNFMPPATNPNPGVGSNPQSVALGDVDGDGDLDLLTANTFGFTVSVRLNNGSGNFTPHPINPEPGVGSYPRSVALGDVDGDGDLDLLCANSSSDNISVRLNDGSGNYTAPAINPEPGVGSVPFSVALGDVDGDGDLDFVTANANINDATVSVRLNNGSGNFTPPAINPEPGVGFQPQSVALGDVDGDGDLDLITANAFGSTVSVRLNNGSGNFTPPAINPDPGVGSNPFSMALGDVDGDGDLDLITANSNDVTVSVRLNGPLPLLTLTGLSASPSPVCVGQPLSVTASVGNLSGSYSYTLSNGSNPISGTATTAAFSQPLTASSSGVQTFTLTVSSEGQVATATSSVTVNPLPTAFAVTGGGAYCAGGAGVAIGLEDSQTGFTYQLVRGNTPVGSALAGTGNALSFGLQTTPGNYNVLATFGNYDFLTPPVAGKCQQTMTGTVSVTRTALPTATLLNDGPITCAKRTVILTAGGGTDYNFSGGITASGNSATVTQAGTYTVTVTANGCSSLTTTTVLSNTVVPTAFINPSSTTLTCASPSVSLTAVGTGSVRWDDNSTNAIRTVSSSGTYSVTLTGGNGCTAVASDVVNQDNTAPVASLVSSGTLSCAITSVTLTATPNGLSYRFSAGATQLGNTNQAVVNTGGLYSVTVVSGNGCSASATTSVSADQSLPSVIINPSSATLSCTSPSATLTASGSGSFRWNTGSTDNQISVSSAGTYSVTLTSANGCTAVASAVVSQDNTAPVASLVSSGTLSCGVTSVTLTASPNGLSYVFSAGATQLGSTNQALVSTPGVYSVTVLSGNNGCSAVAQTTVVSSTAVVSVTNPGVTTAMQGVAFSQAFTAAGGVSRSPDHPYSYSLVSGSLPTGLSLATTGVLAGTPTQAGSFTLTVRATDANGCSGVSAPYVLTVNEPVFVGTLRLVAPLYNCTTGAITFRTVGGDGSGVEYRAIGVTDWTTNPNQTVDLPVRQDANAQPLTLQARQGGVTVTYSFDFRLFCNSTVPNQPPVFTQPPTQTATVGQPFAYRIPDNTFRDLNGTAVNFMATNLPAGLSYSPDTRVISGAPTAVGSYSVTLSVSDPLSLSASGVLVIQVNPVAQPPVSTTVNQAPVFNGPLAAQTGTVGQSFTYTLPMGVFTDPNAGDVLTYSAAGLPAGVQFVASSQTISGTPTTAGTYSVSLTVTDQGGLSASGILTVVISPSGTTPPVGAQPLAVIQPLYDCQTGAITFRTAGGDGSPIYFTSIGIVGYSTQTSYVLEAAIRNDANSQPLLIKATQSGITTSYLFDFRLYCNGTVVTNPPVFNGPLPTQTGQEGMSFSYQLPPNSFTALNGGTLNYAVTGLPAGLSFTAGSNLISGVPTQAGSVTATITATDPLNQSGQGALVFVITPATQPPVGAQPLSLLAPLYDCGTGAFTFRSSGGDGSVTEYFAVGITNYTTIAGPYTVLPASDAQPFTLKARQRGVEVSYTWDFKVVCSGSARVGVAEVAESWTLRSVGNPVTGELVVEVVGAAGQSIELQLTDLNGHMVASRLIIPTTVQHREVFEVSRQGAGVLLLQAQSPTRRQTMKVLKL